MKSQINWLFIFGAIAVIVGILSLVRFFQTYEGDMIAECLTYGCPKQILVNAALIAGGIIGIKLGHNAE